MDKFIDFIHDNDSKLSPVLCVEIYSKIVNIRKGDIRTLKDEDTRMEWFIYKKDGL